MYSSIRSVHCPAWALATPDGQLAKTAKSTLLNALEKDVNPVESAPSGAAWVIDAMAVLQSITSPPPTFAELAELIFSITTQSYCTGSTRADFVTDQYLPVSIKNTEREHRGKSGTFLWKITHPMQKCPLRNGNNSFQSVTTRQLW